jgi:hypothetical protein|tara:strand:+ start:421 stop:666 length:246 start_codon:yes stop_codon:yes gene_type:complete
MAIIFVTIAFLLCWLWLEISLFFFKKNSSESDNIEGISYKKFVWILRIFIIVLFIGLVIYMNFFENIQLQEAIKYCLGIIK